MASNHEYSPEEREVYSALAPHDGIMVASQVIWPIINFGVGNNYDSLRDYLNGENDAPYNDLVHDKSYRVSVYKDHYTDEKGDIYAPIGGIAVRELLIGEECRKVTKLIEKVAPERHKYIQASRWSASSNYVREFHIDEALHIDGYYYMEVNHPELEDPIIVAGNTISLQYQIDPAEEKKLPGTLLRKLSDQDIEMLRIAALAFKVTPDIQASFADFNVGR